MPVVAFIFFSFYVYGLSMSVKLCLFLLTAPLFAGFISAVAAQDSISFLDEVDTCDILAAHPDDPLRVAPGVPDEEIVPRLVETACSASMENTNDVARHAFQLSRALLELDRRDDALKLLHRAADEGSAIAHIFIGDSHQFGWVGDANPQKALEHYNKARSMGLLIADVAIDQLIMDPDIFTTGAMVQVLADADIDTAARYAQSRLAPPYLYAFALELAERCGAFLRPESVALLQDYRFPQGWSPVAEDGDHDIGVQDVLATYDVEVLVDRHGCIGVVVESIANSFNDLLKQLGREG